MTDADRRERTEAKRQAEDALANAKHVRDRGAKIAQGWQRSRSDNNFRLMLRNLVREAPRAS